jgi:hypothetical protein
LVSPTFGSSLRREIYKLKGAFNFVELLIKTNQKRLSEEAPSQIKHLRNNLFVPAHLAEIVEANMQESIKNLQTLELKLEKIIHLYS